MFCDALRVAVLVAPYGPTGYVASADVGDCEVSNFRMFGRL